MNLKSFGCSFIFGSELNDAGLRPEDASKLTWPAHLANNQGYDYICYARPGSGNLQIAEKVLVQAATTETALFVINWSWVDRFDYVGTVESTQIWMPDQPGIDWSTVMPTDQSDIADFYYRGLHSEIQDKLTTLINVRVVIDTLKQKNLPFIMTYMDDLMFDQRWNSSPAIADLQEYIRPYMTTFEGLTFLEWSKKYQYPISNLGHPLEDAHSAAGRYISALEPDKYHYVDFTLLT
jgi:hypothetical protein